MNNLSYRARARALAFALALACAFDLDRADILGLEEVEALSMGLYALVKPGTQSAEVYGDLFLAAALALEQQAGRLPPPVGIALVRTTRKGAQMVAGA